ncbi:MAG TPA: aminotransferase class I/II-fold pyridoxal phosphate-dependent enzyme [Stellaceae bacterium]|nr:aminotransferase class I/II-fold pyridoxal phosphate-dependent enzyme [Stellaceae bacterium]
MSLVEIATKHIASDKKRELANRLLRQRANHGPLGSHANDTDAIPEAFYQLDQHPAYLELLARMHELDPPEIGGVPYFRSHQGLARDTTRIAERECISFSNYNYLGLSGHPALKAAVAEAIDRYGTSVSASRLVGGERPLHVELENTIADALDTEACLAFVSGYGTNVTTLAHLFGPNDLILHDSLAHNSIQTGALLSGARRIAFRHNDWQRVDDLLRRYRRDYERVVVVLEGIYSMDGDFPDLPRFVEIRERHKVILMVDEAHSFGVMGKGGHGLREHFGLKGSDVDIWMGTLSKSLASCGGYIAGSRALILNLKFNAPGFVFSVGLPPANTAAALAALQVMAAEPVRVAELHERGALFLKLANERGLPTGQSMGISIVPLIVGDTRRCVALTNALFARGIDVQPILYPGVKERAVRLRFFINRTHSEEQIRRAIDIIDEEWLRISSAAV